MKFLSQSEENRSCRKMGIKHFLSRPENLLGRDLKISRDKVLN